MTAFYRVTQKFFNNGKVTSDMDIVYAKTQPANSFDETALCDIYEDYFSDKADAIVHHEAGLAESGKPPMIDTYTFKRCNP